MCFVHISIATVSNKTSNRNDGNHVQPWMSPFFDVYIEGQFKHGIISSNLPDIRITVKLIA